ncbi:MAG: hypothetical protein M5U28_06045 [Sandaracinaceae bacterium]|nr:hypothetical protein [Sandaracinaceae bacterium]
MKRTTRQPSTGTVAPAYGNQPWAFSSPCASNCVRVPSPPTISQKLPPACQRSTSSEPSFERQSAPVAGSPSHVNGRPLPIAVRCTYTVPAPAPAREGVSCAFAAYSAWSYV